jgi:peptidoglycan-associated lipoprotein
MKKLLVGICVAALLVTGCGTKGSSSSSGKAGVEDHSLSEQNKTDAQKAADAQSKADAAARQAADDKRKQDEARKAADQAVVKPLPDTRMSAKPLTDVASMLKDPGSPLSKRSVYYDFDMYNIREEFQPSIEAHAKFLVEHKELRVRIEGNCDERGSREYNLALGQRRADSVKRALTLLGVTPKQVETVSFGSEKPKATGSNEEAWAENRRSDIVYIGIDSTQ